MWHVQPEQSIKTIVHSWRTQITWSRHNKPIKLRIVSFKQTGFVRKKYKTSWIACSLSFKNCPVFFSKRVLHCSSLGETSKIAQMGSPRWKLVQRLLIIVFIVNLNGGKSYTTSEGSWTEKTIFYHYFRQFSEKIQIKSTGPKKFLCVRYVLMNFFPK